MTADVWYGWVAIGAAASLAGMVWPFQRGATGVAANMCASIVGAVALPLPSYLVVHSSTRHATEIRLLFAAFGAILGLAVLHLAWTRALAGRRGGEAPSH